MSRRSWRIVVTIVVAAVAVGIAAYLRFASITVAVLAPQSDVAIKVFGLGTVEARILAKIGFKVAGTLTDLRADHGDRIAAGQVLALIDSSEQRTRLAKAKAQLASAEAAVQVAEAATQKAETLVAQRIKTSQRRQSLLERQSVSVEAADDAQSNAAVAQADLLVAKSEIDSARAKRDEARAQLESDSVILAQHELKAPFDGIVVSRAKELGAVLGAGEALFTLVAPETVWVLAYRDEARAGDIAVGQAVEVRLRSLPQRMFHGKVARIGIESDRVNEERRFYVSCDDCPPGFFLGEQAEVQILTGTLPRALMIPEAMIDRFDGTAGAVWTIEDGRLHRRQVKLGRRALDGRVELRDGLPVGALVPAELRDGFAEGRAAAGSAP
jgi:HlyD family secretion protein